MHKQKLTDTGETVFFSMAVKDTESGFSSNKRAFVVIENQLMCYLSKPDLLFTKTRQYITKTAKVIVPLHKLGKMSFKPQDKKAFLRFKKDEDGKNEEILWTLTMETEGLVREWQDIFNEYMNRSRKTTLEKDFKEPKQLVSPDLLRHRMMDNFPENIGPPSPDSAGRQNMGPISEHDQLQNHFQNHYFVTQQNVIQPPAYPQQQSNIKVEMPPVNERSSYFASAQQSQSNLKRHSFKNYFRPYLDNILNITKINIRENLFEEFEEKYTTFINYAESSVREVIEHEMAGIRQKSQDELVRYEGIDDLIIELGLVEMKNVKDGNYVSSESLSKTLRNKFKNWQFVYDTIRQDPALIDAFFVPMACIVTYKGYQCLVSSKIVPNQDQDYDSHILVPHRETSKLFQRLSVLANVQFEVFEREKMIRFLPRNARRDKFAITEVGAYLPEIDEDVVLRAEAFREIYPLGSHQKHEYFGGGMQMQSQRQRIVAFVRNRVSQLGELMDKLELYPMGPSQMSSILHHFGLNSRQLSHIYKATSQTYMQGLIKTEVVVRVFTTIFNRKLQDDCGTSNQPVETAKALINLLLGLGEQSGQLWKVVSLHSQLQYGLSVEKQEVNKGYLLLGLTQRLGAQLLTNYSGVSEVFKQMNYLEAVRFHPSTTQPDLAPVFLQNILKEVQVPLDQAAHDRLMTLFDFRHRDLPNFITNNPPLHHKVLLLMSYFTSPTDKTLTHLGMYGQSSGGEFIRVGGFEGSVCQRRLMEAKWLMKLESPKEKIVDRLSAVREWVSHYYGSHHPFLSEVLELESTWQLGIGEQNEAIKKGKESLSNMIQCCGNNNRHLKLSNNHFQLGQCYRGCRKWEEALNHYKKAKNILQLNSYHQRPQYACLLHKIGEMYLIQGKDLDSYQLLFQAMKVYQSHSLEGNWGQLVQIYQNLARCDMSQGHPKGTLPVMSGLKLAEHVMERVSQVARSQDSVCEPGQLIQVLRLIIEPHFRLLNQETRALLRDYLTELCDDQNSTPAPLQPRTARPTDYFMHIVRSQRLESTLLAHLQHSPDTLVHLRQEKRIGYLMSQRKNPQAEQYDLFMRQLVGILGEPFLLHTLE